ncbi:hypothetical protein [Spiroplasma turonicum]|uniref:Uncharacterized protein n=1 Tax=Spiroplasma turonicum TaxID=216946 RepID=A0A0K1P848_9MOLU|nr:hypothetical protein [Spiroplasma turonicum]AKU80052.1 hypothetical protein STURON_00806 [Spiroplasma turonicum]ALX71054.1 hypothetical protein STURO_v1c08030 [Spiroplasma turonicum]
MTESQAQAISNYIDELPDETADKMFEELVAGMSSYFAILIFGEEIDKLYDPMINEGKTLEEISSEVKKITLEGEEIYSNLVGSLQEEGDAEFFAEDCVQSISFNPEYPEVIVNKLKELEIEESDFSANLIINFRDQFIDFFLNDIDIDEWKSDIIDALVASWN